MGILGFDPGAIADCRLRLGDINAIDVRLKP
jgi:hypothetical protein